MIYESRERVLVATEHQCIVNAKGQRVSESRVPNANRSRVSIDYLDAEHKAYQKPSILKDLMLIKTKFQGYRILYLFFKDESNEFIVFLIVK